MYNIVCKDLLSKNSSLIILHLEDKFSNLEKLDSFTMNFENKDQLAAYLCSKNPILKRTYIELYVKKTNSYKIKEILYSDIKAYFNSDFYDLLFTYCNNLEFVQEFIKFAYTFYKKDYALLNQLKNKLYDLKYNGINVYDLVLDIIRSFEKNTKSSKIPYNIYRSINLLIYNFDKKHGLLKKEETNDEEDMTIKQPVKSLTKFENSELTNDGQIIGQMKFF